MSKGLLLWKVLHYFVIMANPKVNFFFFVCVCVCGLGDAMCDSQTKELIQYINHVQLML